MLGLNSNWNLNSIRICGAQRDKDPGDLAGDLGRPLRGAGKEGERKALTRGPGVAAGVVSACVRRALRAERGWQVGLGRDAG